MCLFEGRKQRPRLSRLDDARVDPQLQGMIRRAVGGRTHQEEPFLHVTLVDWREPILTWAPSRTVRKNRVEAPEFENRARAEAAGAPGRP